MHSVRYESIAFVRNNQIFRRGNESGVWYYQQWVGLHLVALNWLNSNILSKLVGLNGSLQVLAGQNISALADAATFNMKSPRCDIGSLKMTAIGVQYFFKTFSFAFDHFLTFSKRGVRIKFVNPHWGWCVFARAAFQSRVFKKMTFLSHKMWRSFDNCIYVDI